MNKIILQYIKVKNKRKGILLAFKDNNENVCVGYSVWKFSDVYDEFLAFDIAYDRALKYNNINYIPRSIAQSIKKDLYFFIKRIRRYYKNQSFPIWLEAFEINYECYHFDSIEKHIKKYNKKRENEFKEIQQCLKG